MPSRNAPRDLRASDADRERIVSLLAEAVSDGRLTLDEHAERLERASSARTLGDLAGLTTDLVTPDQQPLRLDGTRPVTAVFGGQRREGRWVVPERLTVAAVCAEAVLDFREALLQSSHVIVFATVILGRLKILVPDGVVVEVSGTWVGSSRRGPVRRRTAEPGGQAGAGRGAARYGGAGYGAADYGAADYGAAGSGSVGYGAAGYGVAGRAAAGDGPVVIEVRGLIMGGRVQAITPPRAKGFLGLFPRRGR